MIKLIKGIVETIIINYEILFYSLNNHILDYLHGKITKTELEQEINKVSYFNNNLTDDAIILNIELDTKFSLSELLFIGNDIIYSKILDNKILYASININNKYLKDKVIYITRFLNLFDIHVLSLGINNLIIKKEILSVSKDLFYNLESIKEIEKIIIEKMNLNYGRKN